MKTVYFWVTAIVALVVAGSVDAASDNYTNSIGMEFVLVPAGSYWMGTEFNPKASDNEMPQHEVILTEQFYLGKYEVTQSQWEAIMGNNPSKFKKGGNHPVEQVSWDDVRRFVRRINAKERTRKYRLPTEAEWEYACRSGGKNEKYSGSNSIDRVGWYNEEWDRGHHPVGGKSPNGLGLYDMSGNVWEWVQDVYKETAYDDHTTKNPIYEGSGSGRVGRGGSWGSFAGDVRCAYRFRDGPDNRLNYLGFRLARTP